MTLVVDEVPLRMCLYIDCCVQKSRYGWLQYKVCKYFHYKDLMTYSLLINGASSMLPCDSNQEVIPFPQQITCI